MEQAWQGAVRRSEILSQVCRHEGNIVDNERLGNLDHALQTGRGACYALHAGITGDCNPGPGALEFKIRARKSWSPEAYIPTYHTDQSNTLYIGLGVFEPSRAKTNNGATRTL
jgi:hypothetical protein